MNFGGMGIFLISQTVILSILTDTTIQVIFFWKILIKVDCDQFSSMSCNQKYAK